MKLLSEENRDLPVAQLVCVARGGSSLDPAEHAGLANAAAELALRGAGGRDRSAFDDAVDRLGGALSIETEPDFVRLVGRVLARNLDPFLDLIADVLRRATLSADELERLRVELHGGLDDLRDDDRALATRFHARAAYQGTPYQQPGDGTDETLDRITREHCVHFWREHLRVEAMMVGTAGEIAAAEAHSRLAARLGADALRGEVPPAPAPAALPALPPARRLIVVDKPERSQVQLLLGHVAPPLAHPDALALQVALTAFGGMFSSPLMQEVRVKRGWSYGVHAWLEPRVGPGAITLHLFPANGQAPDALRLVLELVEKLVSEGLPGEVLERASEFLVNSLAMELDTPEKRIARRLAVELYGLPPDYLETYRARVAALPSEEAIAAVRRHLHPDRLLVTAVATASTSEAALTAAGGFASVERHAYDSY